MASQDSTPQLHPDSIGFFKVGTNLFTGKKEISGIHTNPRYIKSPGIREVFGRRFTDTWPLKILPRSLIRNMNGIYQVRFDRETPEFHVINGLDSTETYLIRTKLICFNPSCDDRMKRCTQCTICHAVAYCSTTCRVAHSHQHAQECSSELLATGRIHFTEHGWFGLGRRWSSN